ncbi:uncharacterized protein MONBRDRAFT_32506 [Monosiga brevicollis MX1]|uniref:3'(2'),5'-bisphosphate nucleotidase n=1 Tax=Monosiga brevicollis TaxID=81824 RepID=A9UZZ2_MONBE|nr:uncharacterized protein MONBRDRAFT_32506 [Monosiga brevicollis MX1]EDQ88924.1 predicted protein [Monosiga brevicollis MX1]|eukprot:XP_001746029.1 hypothetical protein [Monosiga brevicollis MX1]
MAAATKTSTTSLAALGDAAVAAVRAVVAASRVCETVRTGELMQSMSKDDKSPVTVADFAAQAIVIHELHAFDASIPVVGEEDADALRGDAEEATQLRQKVMSAVHSLRTDLDEAAVLGAIDRGNYEGGASGRFWALDPIDGTKGFLRNDQYAVALGLVEDGQVVLGVLGCPNLREDLDNPESVRGCGYVAKRGEGCFKFNLDNCESLTKATVTSPPAEEVRLVESVETKHTSHDTSAQIKAAANIKGDSVRMDSQAKYAVVGRGDAHLYLRLPRAGSTHEEKIWDHAGGMLIVEEAGGRVTDIHGKPLDFGQGQTLKNNTGVVASNGVVHDAVIAALAEIYKN